MNSILRKIFTIIEYGNFREEPFVLTRTRSQPQAWNNDRRNILDTSNLCVVDELLAARAEARSVSFRLAKFGCLTGRLQNKTYGRFRDDEYLTFKPFSMVTAHESPELLVLFCPEEYIQAFLKALNEISGEIEIPPAPVFSGSCLMLTLPLVHLSEGSEKVLLCDLRPDNSPSQDSGLMAVLPMKMVLKMADSLLIGAGIIQGKENHIQRNGDY